MCLINKDGKVCTCKVIIRGYLVQSERECLQSNDDDLTAVVKGLRKLFIFRSLRTGIRISADHLNKAGCLFKLLYRPLDVGIEANTVRNYNNGRKQFLTVRLTDIDKFVCCPAYRFCLARSGRMFDQIPLTDTVFLYIVQAFGNAVPLMETGEQLLLYLFQPPGRVFLLLYTFKNEVVEDTEPVLFLADIVPEISGRIFRIIPLHRVVACVSVRSALIERQEMGFIRLKVRTHPDLRFGDSEMHDGSPFIHEQGVLSAG